MKTIVLPLFTLILSMGAPPEVSADSCLDASTYAGATGGAKIQAAINACPTYGCVVCVPGVGPDSGVWSVSTQINLRSNLTLRGVGGPPILARGGAPNSVLSLTNIANANIINLRFDGTPSASCGILFCSAISGSGDDLRFDQLDISGFDRGFNLTGSRIAIEGSHIWGNRERGIQFFELNAMITRSNLRVTTSSVHDNGAHGITFGQDQQAGVLTEVSIRNNIAVHNGTNLPVGGFNYAVAPLLRGVAILGNLSERSGGDGPDIPGTRAGDGFAISRAENVTFASNIATESVESGIELFGFRGYAVVGNVSSYNNAMGLDFETTNMEIEDGNFGVGFGNVLVDNGQNPGRGNVDRAGITMGPHEVVQFVSATANVSADSQIAGTQTYGVRLDNGTSNVTVVGNMCRSNSIAGVSIGSPPGVGIVSASNLQ